MKIIGVDPGYDRIGMAVIEKTEANNWKETLVFSQCYVTDRDAELTDRVFDAGEALAHVIDLYQPEALAIENVYFTKNQKTAMGVSEAKGVFKHVAKQKGLDVFEYTPLQIKTAITGDGGAGKEAVAWMVPKLIRVDLDEKAARAGGTSKGLDDEIDAIAVALTHFAYQR